MADPDGATYGINRDFEERYPLAYAEEMEAFARCVRDDTAPRVTGLDALAAFDLATAADLSWRGGRAVPVTPERLGRRRRLRLRGTGALTVTGRRRRFCLMWQTRCFLQSALRLEPASNT